MSKSVKININPVLRDVFGTTPAKFQREFDLAKKEFEGEAELIYKSFALRQSGRMMRSIKANSSKDGFVVTAEARAPGSGYDYVGVTRFGHRGMIRPVARGRASVIETKRSRGRGRSAALRFVMNGRVLYRRSTKGFHPSQDWAAVAYPTVKREAQATMGRLARKLERG